MKASAIDNGHESDVSSRELTRQLDGEIAILREELSQLVAELDRRRHEAFDLKLQVKRHASEMLVSGGALLAAAAGLVWFQAWRARRRSGLGFQIQRLRQKLMRLGPAKPAAPEGPGIGRQILTAGVSAAVAAGIKRLVMRSLRGPVITQSRLPNTTDASALDQATARARPPRRGALRLR